MSLESDIKGKQVVEPVVVDDCVVCFEPLTNDAEERTVVKLRCSHSFHLDCLGSHFNTKKSMECPCCRQIEKGQWLLPKPVDVDPPFPNIFDMHFQLDLSNDIDDMPTSVGSDSTLPRFFQSDFDTILTHMRTHHWSDTSMDRRMQLHEIDERLARNVDRERRLHDMINELNGRTGGSGYGGEGSGGEAVAEEVEAGEEAEGAEVTEE
ncbi:Zinc finger RING-type [Arabidopsis suecica]|uniref:Zinc finger RING-type n=1 Tax=Arabidopsis suecica TaxID=45249 RepID=A0A8T1YPJ7_ARASU|nr:Zinc finger RING-type [Arabidopsis suecica]